MCVLMFKRAHVPDGEIADALASTLTCTTAADALVNYRWYVPQIPEKFPSPQWENCLRACPDSRLHNCKRFGQLQNVRAAETLQTSHRPDGKMTC